MVQRAREISGDGRSSKPWVLSSITTLERRDLADWIHSRTNLTVEDVDVLIADVLEPIRDRTSRDAIARLEAQA
jgi:hypothetical protein